MLWTYGEQYDRNEQPWPLYTVHSQYPLYTWHCTVSCVQWILGVEYRIQCAVYSIRNVRLLLNSHHTISHNSPLSLSLSPFPRRLSPLRFHPLLGLPSISTNPLAISPCLRCTVFSVHYTLYCVQYHVPPELAAKLWIIITSMVHWTSRLLSGRIL